MPDRGSNRTTGAAGPRPLDPVPDRGRWVLVGPDDVLRTARPLIDAHARRREVRLHPWCRSGPVPPAVLGEWVDGAAGALVVSDGRWASRQSVPGPFVADFDARPVPVGWLPLGGRGGGLTTFFSAAARVAGRPANEIPTLAILAQWVPRYLQLAGRLDHHLAGSAERVVWTADRLTRDDLVAGLRVGLGGAVYFGHGRPSGWAGYHGVRAHHLTGADGGPDGARREPLGAVLSMTCYTASRWNVGTSFAEKVVLGGAAAAAVGAVRPVQHLDNMRWMLGFATTLARGETAIGPALSTVLTGAAGPSPYRILGDPLASLAGTPVGWRTAQAVDAPDPATFSPHLTTGGTR